MVLLLHPELQKSLNNKATALISLLKPIQEREDKGFQPAIEPSIALTSQHILKILSASNVNSRGEIVSRFLDIGNKTAELDEEGCNLLREIAIRIANTSTFINVITVETLESIIFGWVTLNYSDTPNIPEMCSYLIEQCEPLITKTEFWIPLFNTYIESEIELGNVRFITLSRELLNVWLSNLAQSNPSLNLNEVESNLISRMGNFIGLAAANVTVTTEPQMAKSLAFQEAERSMAFFRVFFTSPPIATMAVHSDLMGLEYTPKRVLFSSTSENPLSTEKSIISPHGMQSKIDSITIEKMLIIGLIEANELLKIPQPSKYQQAILDAIALYSKVTLQQTLEDKLVYLFSSLESLLLKDGNEPVMFNLADRFAFFLHTDREKRKETVALVKTVYGKRSAFMHHGKRGNIEEKDERMLNEFLSQVRIFYVNLIKGHSAFADKNQMLEHLDNIKYQ